jgi:hypothetical protein
MLHVLSMQFGGISKVFGHCIDDVKLISLRGQVWRYRYARNILKRLEHIYKQFNRQLAYWILGGGDAWSMCLRKTRLQRRNCIRYYSYFAFQILLLDFSRGRCVVCHCCWSCIDDIGVRATQRLNIAEAVCIDPTFQEKGSSWRGMFTRLGSWIMYVIATFLFKLLELYID